MNDTDTVHTLIETANQHTAEYARVDPGAVEHLGALRQAGASIASATRAHDIEIAKIDKDTTLSPEGKRQQRERAAERLRQALQRAVDGTAPALEALDKRATFTPPALEADPALAEAKLANARTDLRMMLDPVDPTDLAEALRAAVRQPPSDAARHLALFTDWPEAYMRSRGAREAQRNLWREYRRIDAPQHLTGRALEAWQRSIARQSVDTAAQLIRHAAGFGAADRGLAPEGKTGDGSHAGFATG